MHKLLLVVLVLYSEALGERSRKKKALTIVCRTPIFLLLDYWLPHTES